MSLDIVKKEINRFLSSEVPEVLALHGDWGEGKTYTWNKLIECHAKEIALPKYAYVSLFGVNSILELESALICETICSKELETQKDKSISYIVKRSLAFFKDLPKISDYSNLAVRIASKFILENSIICIDDIERKSDKLEIGEIFGLVMKLKEQKKCKIVLIYSGNFFEGQDKNAYEKFREKVIDINLRFNITPDEAIKIVFTKNDYLEERIKHYSLMLKITNIRILEKIKRLSEILYLKLNDEYKQDVLDKAIRYLVLLTWCYYSKHQENNSKIPDFEFVKNFKFEIDSPRNGIKPEVSNEAIWRALLHDYGYDYKNALSLIIASGVECGYFDDKLLEEASKLNEELLKIDRMISLEKSWKIYHDSFDDNENEVISSIKAGVVNNYNVLSISNLDALVKLFNNLDRNEEAKEMVDLFFDKNRKDLILSQLDSEEIKNDYIKNKIRGLKEELTDEKNLKEILVNYSRNAFLTADNSEYLNERSVDDLYALFISEKDDLSRIVTACLSLSMLCEKAKTALQRISKTNRLNKERVSKYGIE